MKTCFSSQAEIVDIVTMCKVAWLSWQITAGMKVAEHP
jgi:hypothetical protein